MSTVRRSGAASAGGVNAVTANVAAVSVAQIFPLRRYVRVKNASHSYPEALDRVEQLFGH